MSETIRTRQKIRLLLALGTILIVYAIDQGTKAYFFTHYDPLKRGLWFFIEPATNYGAVFGLFPQWAGAILFVGILFLFMFLAFVRHVKMKSDNFFVLGLGLQMGGAIGNISDRIQLGYVRDFIALHIWPIFNLADVSILTGCVLLLLNLKEKS